MHAVSDAWQPHKKRHEFPLSTYFNGTRATKSVLHAQTRVKLDVWHCYLRWGSPVNAIHPRQKNRLSRDPAKSAKDKRDKEQIVQYYVTVLGVDFHYGIDHPGMTAVKVNAQHFTLTCKCPSKHDKNTHALNSWFITIGRKSEPLKIVKRPWRGCGAKE